MKRRNEEALNVLNDYLQLPPSAQRQRVEAAKKVKDVFSQLPPQVAARILSYLSLAQLNAMKTVSHFFEELIGRFELTERLVFNGQVYAFGDGKLGKLGDGIENNHFVSTSRLVNGQFNQNVTQVSCGEFHTAFISNGQVYAFGNGESGQLGNGRDDYHHSVSTPRLVNGPFNQNVTQVSCGERHTAFISDGRVYTFGYGQHGRLGDGIENWHNVTTPRMVNGPFNQNVTQISCGESHTAFISNGRVYAFGYGQYGQLGDGIENNHNVSTPRLVDGPFNQNVTQVSCGERHTAFISDGRVYTFGDGRFGKLGDGRSDMHNVSTPRLVNGPFNQNVTQISCGLHHTAFISNGRVYTFGLGHDGQLGDGIEEEDNHAVSTPQLVIGPFNQNVTQVSCGSFHTAFISNGKVYAFGNSLYGRLGDGRDYYHSVFTPQLVIGPFNRYVTQVSCGSAHTAFVSQKPDFPVIASCVVCQMVSLSICDQCQEVYCDDCFEKSH